MAVTTVDMLFLRNMEINALLEVVIQFFLAPSFYDCIAGWIEGRIKIFFQDNTIDSFKWALS